MVKYFLFMNQWWLLIMMIYFVQRNLCKTYERCELARELRDKFRFKTDELSQWICLIRWESEYNTSAIGSLNSDGSLDHGLFQISDKYWCYGPGPGEHCAISCDALRDDDISDDVKCVKRIYRAHKHLSGNGFHAWVAWKQHCQGDTASYTEGCFDNDIHGEKSSDLDEDDNAQEDFPWTSPISWLNILLWPF